MSAALLSVDQEEGSGKSHLLSKILKTTKQVKKYFYYYCHTLLLKLETK